MGCKRAVTYLNCISRHADLCFRFLLLNSSFQFVTSLRSPSYLSRTGRIVQALVDEKNDILFILPQRQLTGSSDMTATQIWKPVSISVLAYRNYR